MLTKFKKLFKDDLIFHTAIVFCGTTLAGVCSLFYHLASVRLLTPEDYGTLNALISLTMFAPIAISPLGTILPRFFTEYITKKDFTTLRFVLSKLAKRLIIAAVLIFILLLLGSSFLADFLKTKSIYVIAVAVIISFSFISLLFLPLFQSFQRFKLFSFIGFTSAFSKLIVGALLMFLGWGIVGGLSGFFASHIVIILISLLFMPGIFKEKIGGTNTVANLSKSLIPIYKYCFPVSIVMISFTILTSVDVILVKHFFSPLDAGYYSIAQMVGKIALFLPSALAIVILPKSTKAYVSNIQPHKFLYKSLFIGGGCCLGFIAFSLLFPDLLLNVLTGKLNPTSKSLVGLFSIAMSFYALCWIIINFLLATHNLRFVLPLFIISILEALSIYFYHTSLTLILWILLAYSIIAFLVNLFIARQFKPYNP